MSQLRNSVEELQRVNVFHSCTECIQSG